MCVLDMYKADVMVAFKQGCQGVPFNITFQCIKTDDPNRTTGEFPHIFL